MIRIKEYEKVALAGAEMSLLLKILITGNQERNLIKPIYPIEKPWIDFKINRRKNRSRV